MKKVEAEVRKERFPEVDSALRKLGVPGLTVAEQRRSQRGRFFYPLENIPHVLLTVVVDDANAMRVVDSIQKSGSTRSWGDGRIVVSAVDGVLDIGSGRYENSELLAPGLTR